MKLYSLICDKFKLDGGACFGVVPKSIWQKLYPADENNMIDIVSRSLLIDTGERKILIYTGMGKKKEEKKKSKQECRIVNDVFNRPVAEEISANVIDNVKLGVGTLGVY